MKTQIILGVILIIVSLFAICLHMLTKKQLHLIGVEKKIAKKAKKVIQYFSPDFSMDSYTINLIVDEKTLLIQVLADKIIIYCKETNQTYLIESTNEKEIESSLEDIRKDIFNIPQTLLTEEEIKNMEEIKSIIEEIND
jgi:hypothetical protein